MCEICWLSSLVPQSSCRKGPIRCISNGFCDWEDLDLFYHSVILQRLFSSIIVMRGSVAESTINHLNNLEPECSMLQLASYGTSKLYCYIQYTMEKIIKYCWLSSCTWRCPLMLPMWYYYNDTSNRLLGNTSANWELFLIVALTGNHSIFLFITWQNRNVISWLMLWAQSNSYLIFMVIKTYLRGFLIRVAFESRLSACPFFLAIKVSISRCEGGLTFT